MVEGDDNEILYAIFRLNFLNNGLFFFVNTCVSALLIRNTYVRLKWVIGIETPSHLSTAFHVLNLSTIFNGNLQHENIYVNVWGLNKSFANPKYSNKYYRWTIYFAPKIDEVSYENVCA